MKSDVRVQKQDNAIVAIIPSNLAVTPGTRYKVEKKANGEFILKPSKKTINRLDDLFKNWHGCYQRATDLNVWENTKPVGKELW
ncbi:hypothetical protein [Loigolactobacillus bifermentans]|jgi:antitoxin component of MazEF toxin-antitoxin module|uniref:AbrB/MazE/SpoVT family DNA-binding domain-containing protein n=1 Tax=Loigolactobacillus bifermentans TaxID=1607 RepID=UPI00070E1F7C|nr:hypothetical protein [Loigolactobacillus bifermentans]QGG60513.1 hypothetical protein LB003_08575 [Loigolactobacillus bifermentans]